ncbi:hypothetical protein [Neoroseomonas soli]|uniref:Alpha/beta hydrolase n=1 Tax=Neoroseomonas soli TaxID=1081025 RepID=A0A9X9X4R0_9PROT|nr:hypothetical protein [Neoroseomonas soli]MBR0674389.1 hypothetical protein [Neoroseomonas soli]
MLPHRLAAATLAAMLAAAPGLADEYATYQQVEFTPVGAGGMPACTSSALLNRPDAWVPGDAAVVMLGTGPQLDRGRDPLLAALLSERAAVLEVTPGTCETSSTTADTKTDALDALAGALVALRQAGAGMVVAIGFGGTATAATVEAMDGSALAGRFGPDGPRFAAGFGVEAGTPVFAPPGRESAGGRLDLLCRALAQAIPGGARGAAACAAAFDAGAAGTQAVTRARP